MADDNIHSKKSVQASLDAWSEELADPTSAARAELKAEIEKRLREKLGPPRSDSWPRKNKDGETS